MRPEKASELQEELENRFLTYALSHLADYNPMSVPILLSGIKLVNRLMILRYLCL